jgi:hypothetical protein
MNSKLVKTENSEFMKDMATGALVSTNLSEFQKYKLREEQSQKLKTQENDLNNIKSEVSDLKNQLGEIKDLLHQLLIK